MIVTDYLILCCIRGLRATQKVNNNNNNNNNNNSSNYPSIATIFIEKAFELLKMLLPKVKTTPRDSK